MKERRGFDAAGRDVLAHLTGRDGEAGGRQLSMQLRVEQVHLAQIGLGRIARHPRAVLDRLAHVRVVFDSEPRQELPDICFVTLSLPSGVRKPGSRVDRRFWLILRGRFTRGTLSGGAKPPLRKKKAGNPTFRRRVD